jgi:chromosome segregation ATPase
MEEDIEQLRIRCEILERERGSLAGEGERFGKQRGVLVEVIDTLKGEKRKNERERERLEEEGELIARCLTQKLEEMELLGKRLKEVQDKERVVEKALAPLRKEKEKQELLEIARLVGKK